MKIPFEVVSIQILRGFGLDKVSLKLQGPSPFQGTTGDPLEAEFQMPAGHAERWVQEYFPGVPTEIIVRPS